MNLYGSLGHDARTGDFAVLSKYGTLGGGASIGDDAPSACMHPCARARHCAIALS
jgi:hypothetical protein